MASSREYLDFILEHLSGLERIAYRAMMGEFILDTGNCFLNNFDYVPYLLVF